MKFSKWNLVPLLLAVAALICIAQIEGDKTPQQTEGLPRAHPFSTTSTNVTD